jgi:hypothetical protein
VLIHLGATTPLKACICGVLHRESREEGFCVFLRRRGLGKRIYARGRAFSCSNNNMIHAVTILYLDINCIHYGGVNLIWYLVTVFSCHTLPTV